MTTRQRSGLAMALASIWLISALARGGGPGVEYVFLLSVGLLSTGIVFIIAR